jgi:geranylgeranyl reductase family protein
VDVLLIEKSALPRVKVCGGGVVKRALRHLPDDVVLPVERECRRVSMRLLDGGFAHTVERPDTIVAMTMRAALDHHLASAAERSGARFISPCAVKSIERRGEHVEMSTSLGTVRADFVVVADGATGPCARMAGFDEALATIPALEAEVRVDDETLRTRADTAAFDFGGVVAGGYGWVFGKREHLSCGVLSMKRGSVHLRARLDAYLHAAGIRPLSLEVRGYVIPMRPRAGGFARERVLLAGDAAGFADPVTAEGISLAMHSGEIAARAIIEQPDARAVERAHGRMLRREIGAELRVARIVANIVYDRPRLAQRLFQHAGVNLCEAMTGVSLGDRGYRGLLMSPRAWTRLVLG